MVAYTGEAGLLVVLIGISAFFSATEVAFLSISTVKVHALLAKDGLMAASLSRLKQKGRRVIISLLLWNSLANVSSSAIATSIALNTFGEQGLGIAVGVMTFLLLTFAEIIPKSLAAKYFERMMPLISPLVEVFYYASLPFVILFEQFNRLIPGLYPDSGITERITKDEVRAAVKLGSMGHGITSKERSLIENALAMDSWEVSKAMTSAKDAVSFQATDTLLSAYQKALSNFHLHYPVIQNGRVVGMVSMKLLGKISHQHPEWPVSKIASPLLVLQEDEMAGNAFLQLQKMKKHMAAVEDRQGKFVGIVTTLDLLREIVGEVK